MTGGWARVTLIQLGKRNPVMVRTMNPRCMSRRYKSVSDMGPRTMMKLPSPAT